MKQFIITSNRHQRQLESECKEAVYNHLFHDNIERKVDAIKIQFITHRLIKDHPLLFMCPSLPKNLQRLLKRVGEKITNNDDNKHDFYKHIVHPLMLNATENKIEKSEFYRRERVFRL